MKNKPDHLDELLQGYLDGTLSPEQRERLDRELVANPDLQNRLQLLSHADRLLQSLGLEEPSAKFTQRVMKRLPAMAPANPLSIRKSVLLLLGILVTAGIAAALAAAGAFDSQTSVNVNELNIATELIRYEAPTFTIDVKWLVNAIVLVSLAMAFLLLDRAILRPWFGRRMQTNP